MKGTLRSLDPHGHFDPSELGETGIVDLAFPGTLPETDGDTLAMWHEAQRKADELDATCCQMNHADGKGGTVRCLNPREVAVELSQADHFTMEYCADCADRFYQDKRKWKIVRNDRIILSGSAR